MKRCPEFPILFAGSLVRAIRNGAKTQTRRLVTPGHGQKEWLEPETIQRVHHWEEDTGWWKMSVDGGHIGSIRCPFGVSGQGHQLWVKETHAFIDLDTGYEARRSLKKYVRPQKQLSVVYKVGMSDFEESLISKWRPSIFMPRWASRISLELLDVRIERLNSITEEDAKAEGVLPFFERFPSIGRDQFLTTGERAADSPYRASFACLWDELSEGPLWKDNPWTWVLSFRRTESPR
jgi:hypothetical protein